MFATIIKLSWKSFKRNPALTQNIATTVLLGFFALYFGLVAVGLGALAPKAITEMYPDVDGPIYFGRYFLYFIIYSFLTRLIFQNFSFKDLKYFLIQNVPKRKIFHYMLIRSVFNWINVMSVAGVVAYLISSTFTDGYEMNVLSHSIVLLGLIFASNFKAFLFDKQLSLNKWLSISLIVGVLILNFVDYKGYIPLGQWLESIYAFFVSNIVTAMIPMLGAILLYYLTISTLSKVAYLEDIDAKSDNVVGEHIGAGLFSRFGKVGELMALEAKLILRNKRSRNMLLIVPLMMVYPFIIHRGGSMNSMGWMMFVAIFCTGGYALTYGQLLLSWNSGHFDLLLTRMDSIKDIFKAKYYLMCCIVLIQGLPMILYGFYITDYFLLMPAMMCYVLGVVLFMYMLSASYNSKKISTNKGAAMNYEGMSMALFLIIIPIMAIPMVFYYGFNYLGHPKIGVIIVSLLGLLGFMFNDKLIDISVNLFTSNRYKIGKAFRSK